MIVAAGKDVRVLVIKLADRLHNMRTLDARSPASRARIATATLDVLVPLCDRLGIQALKRDLDDVVLYHLEPEAYARIDEHVRNRPGWNEYLTRRDRPRPGSRCAAPGWTPTCTGGRRHYYSIWKDTVAGGHAGAARPAAHRGGGGRPGHRLLRRARRDPRPVAPGGRPVQGLHRLAEEQPLPLAAHHGDRAGGPAGRGADPHPVDAPLRRVRRGHRLPLPEDRGPGRDPRLRPADLAPAGAGLGAGHHRRRAVPRLAALRPGRGADPGLRARHHGRAAGRVHAGRPRVRAEPGEGRRSAWPRPSTAGSPR